MDNLKEINGRMISVGRVPPTKAIPLQVALVSLIGPALLQAAGKKGGFANLKSLDPGGTEASDIGQSVIGALSQSLDPDKVMYVVKALMEYVTIDGKRVTSLDEAFIDNMGDLWKTVFFAIQVNFGDFFRAIPSASRAGAMMAESN